MFPVLFRIGGHAIPSYGLFAAVGWMLGIYWWLRQVPHMGWREGEPEFWRLVYLLVGAAIVGGKLLAFLDYRHLASPREMLLNLTGGFVYLGGVIGSGLAGFLFCKVRGYAFWPKADFFAAGLAIGHAVGRIGCLLAGCCYGRPTTLPWGVSYSDVESAVARDWLGIPLHPTQIYETLGEIGIFLALNFYFMRRLIAGKLPPGLTSMAYLGLYGAMRFGVDFLRGDDPDFRVGPLTASQGISLVLIVAALLYARLLVLKARAASA